MKTGTIAFVPARGGSKGVPRKNLALVGGIPLVVRAVESSMRASTVDRVVVSSDDPDILDVARNAGAEVDVRPGNLASDDATTAGVVIDLLQRWPTSIAAVVQPTSPFTSSGSIDRVITQVRAGRRAATTVTQQEHPLSWCARMDASRELLFVNGDVGPTLRQAHEVTYRLTGGAYAIRPDDLLASGTLLPPGTVGVLVDRRESIDIDDEFDLRLAQLLAESG